jgi:hypothetical protein
MTPALVLKTTVFIAAANLLLASCGKHKTTESFEPEPLIATQPKTTTDQTAPNVAPEKTLEIKLEEAPVALLQSSVARLVTQIDMENSPVLVYQDSYSSLYEQFDRSTNPSTASLIYFYTPHFSAGSINISAIDDGKYEIRIENSTSLKATISTIRTELKKKIEKSQETFQLLQLPVSEVRASVRLFGKEFPIKMASDFSEAILEMEAKDLPKDLRSALTPEALRTSMNLFNVTYKYWTLPFSEDQCSLGISNKKLKSMFADAENEAAEPSSAPVANTNAVDRALSAAQTPVTFQLAQKVIEKSQKNMDARCTSPDTGAGMEFLGKVLSTMLDKGMEITFGANSSGAWDKTAEKILERYMDPNTFATTINRINDSLTKKESLSRAFDQSTESRTILKVLTENDSRYLSHKARVASESNSRKGFSSGLPFFPSSGSRGSSASESSEDNEASSTFQRNQNESDAAYATRVNERLNQEGLSMRLAAIDGQIKIIPTIKVTLVGDLNSDDSTVIGYSNKRVGSLKQENGTFAVDTGVRSTASLTIFAKCNTNTAQQTIDLKSSNWSLSPNDALKASINSLSDTLKLNTAPGCYQLTLKLLLSGTEGTLPGLTFNLRADEAKLRSEENTSHVQSVSLNSENPGANYTFGSMDNPDAKWSLNLSLSSIN